MNAAIAQLVEHNLAKVGVASSSLVCRSFSMKAISFPMNLYIRYFDNEILVSNADEALEFLRSIPDFDVTPQMESDVRDYAAASNTYPKRYKVRAHIYFIMIKTNVSSLADFKQKKGLSQQTSSRNDHRAMLDGVMAQLNEERQGWYEGEINFKRVVMVPSTGKCEYRDTKFVVDCKANSPIDCYNRIIEHLRTRVDSRSQFPSVKGKNFRYKYLGYWK